MLEKYYTLEEFFLKKKKISPFRSEFFFKKNYLVTEKRWQSFQILNLIKILLPIT